MSNNLLSDAKYYKRLDRDPTTTIQGKVNKIVKKLYDNKFISDDERKKLSTYSSYLGRYYGLVKIHKPTLQLRPIISCIDTATVNLSKMVSKILTASFTSKYSVKDTFTFVDKVNSNIIPENYVLVSLDVTSLFSNVPLDLVLSVIADRWNDISVHTKINKEMFLELIQLLYKSCAFTFQGKFFSQVHGLPMGGSASVILSALALESVIDTGIDRLGFALPFFYLFIDDCLTAVPSNSTKLTLDTFNSVNSNIKFTMELEKNNSVPFLDTLVIRNQDNVIELNWYQKITHSNRYLNYHSFHPPKTKINTLKNLKNRMLYISNPKYRQENLDKLKRIFLQNNYPPKLVNKIVFSSDSEILQVTKSDPVSYKSFPNIPGLSSKIVNLLSSSDQMTIALKNQVLVKQFFSHIKDKISDLQKRNVVYSIKCSCNKYYIGQTQQKLNQRIVQHRSDESKAGKSNALSIHVRESNHLVEYDKTKILTSEPNLRKRLWLEMYYIQKNIDSCLNFKNDTSNLSNIYCNLIEM